jgi:hypothetical protein
VDRLEDRLVLDGFKWLGQAGDVVAAPAALGLGKNDVVRKWEDARNWEDTTNAQNNQKTYPGQDPKRTNDTVEFEDAPKGKSVVSCYLDSDVVVKTVKITALAGVSFHLIIAPTHSLTIKDGEFRLSSGKLDLLEDGTGAHLGSSLNLDNTWGVWYSGQLSTQTGYGHVYIYNKSTLNVETNTDAITGATLVIGWDPKGKTGSRGTLNIATIGVDMNGNLKLVGNATIKNHVDGVVNFNQGKSCGIWGGISVGKGSTLSQVENYGTMNRLIPDAVVALGIPVAKTLLDIEVPVIQDGAKAEFNLGKNCGIKFSGKGGFQLKQGTFTKDPSAVQEGVDKQGGKLVGMATDASGTDSYYALAGLPATGGIITFVDNAGAYGNLVVSGNFTMTSAVLLSMNVGDNPPTADLVTVSGTVSLGDAILSLNALPSLVAASGNTITLIHNTGGSAINGTFNNLKENAIVPVGNYQFTISYKGGTTGEDVVLTYYSTVGSGSIPIPSMTSVSPSVGSTAGGTLVTLTGTSFTYANAVYFGGTPASNLRACQEIAFTHAISWHNL